MKLSFLFGVGCLVGVAACAQQGFGDDSNGNDSGMPGMDGSSSGSCVSCVTDTDCNGAGSCAQLQDSFCAAHCSTSSDCPSGDTCMSVTTVAGQQVQGCVNTASSVCGPNQVQQQDSGPPPNSCPGYAAPSQTAPCTSCTQGSSGCQMNGCFGGWWCNLNTNKCNSPPSGCMDTGGSGTDPSKFFTSFTSNVTTSGGTESNVYFAVIGDCRPANEDDSSSYPTPIITKLFQDMNAVSPKPPFVVSTGDYQFSSSNGNQSSVQLGYYLTAQKNYTGIQFPTMGNHECTGATASNCGPGSSNGITNNYSNFLSMLLAPISQTKPYYSIKINAADNSWTAKYVFVAANAWDSTQSSWLSSALAVSTTYTFIIRHEDSSYTTAPGVSPSEAIIASYPYTLEIVGHAHDYYHGDGTKVVTVGNGGAPISTSQDYGYALVHQLTNGNVQVDMYDYMTNAADSKFTFNVSK